MPLFKQESTTSLHFHFSLASIQPPCPSFAPLSSLSPNSTLWCQSDSVLTIGPAADFQHDSRGCRAVLTHTFISSLAVFLTPVFPPYFPESLLTFPMRYENSSKLNHKSTSANHFLTNLGSAVETHPLFP